MSKMKFLDPQEAEKFKKQKWKQFCWTPCKLQISQFGFYQKMKQWIFSKSTRKGQLKNVQDEISRPLGSREIQKTKVETVLRDTLYDPNKWFCFLEDDRNLKQSYLNLNVVQFITYQVFLTGIRMWGRTQVWGKDIVLHKESLGLFGFLRGLKQPLFGILRPLKLGKAFLEFWGP